MVCKFKVQHLTDKVIYFDFLRIVSMLAVIVLHVASSNWNSDAVKVHSLEWNAFNFYDSIARWGVPVFIMISGALFLSPTRQFTIKKIYSKYIFRIVLVFCAWSFCYACAYKLKGNSLRSAFEHFISGHSHMWFLFMLVGLYMIVPLLRLITDNYEMTKYYLLLSLVFSILIPAIFILLKVVDRLYISGVYDLAQEVYDKMDFHFAVGFSFYFVLGHFLSITTITNKMERIIYILGLVGFISTILLSREISYYFNEPRGVFYDNMTINVMLESVAVFVFCKNRASKSLNGEGGKKVVQSLSALSLGVYLIHPFFIELLKYLGLSTLSFSAIISVPCITVLVFLLSLFISAILNKIPIVNKYLV